MQPEMLIQSLQPIPEENHNIPTISPPDFAAAAAADMTVLERQIVRLNWHQQQQPRYLATAASTSIIPYPFNSTQLAHTFPSSVGSLQSACFSGEQGMMINHDLPSRPANAWPDLRDYTLLSNSSVGGGVTAGGGGNNILRTFSCPPAVGNVEIGGTLSPPASQLEQAASTTKDAAATPPSSDRARDGGSKKRKSVKRSCPKKVEGDGVDKRVKVENSNDHSDENVVFPPINMCSASTAATTTIDYRNGNCEASKREASSSGGSKETKAKVPEPPPKTDYIHVRARRGQATDSHSLAERVRREKISDRMKLLQDLVPGCNKITGKAGMLDEIINYVQSLQRQVEFLSMKLAAVTPALDFNILDALFTKEMNFVACGGGITAAPMGVPPELLDPSFLQFNPLQQPVLAVADQCCGLPAPVVSSSCSPVEAALHTSAGAAEPCSFLGSYDMHQPSTTSGWDGELRRFYGVEELAQGRRGIPTDAAAASTFQPQIHGNFSSDGYVSCTHVGALPE